MKFNSILTQLQKGLKALHHQGKRPGGGLPKLGRCSRCFVFPLRGVEVLLAHWTPWWRRATSCPGGSQKGDAAGSSGGGGGGSDTLLVVEDKTARKLKRRFKRLFHRVMSGMEKGGQLRVMMLSGIDDDVKAHQKAFRALVMWARRRGLMRDYIQVKQYTDSGRVHTHVVWRGSYIDVWLLSREWEKRSGAKVVYCQRVRGKGGMARYLASYLKQGYIRYGWSWGWVFRGFAGAWERFKRDWRYAVHVKGWDVPYWAMLNQWRWHCAVGIPP